MKKSIQIFTVALLVSFLFSGCFESDDSDGSSDSTTESYFILTCKVNADTRQYSIRKPGFWLDDDEGGIYFGDFSLNLYNEECIPGEEGDYCYTVDTVSLTFNHGANPEQGLIEEGRTYTNEDHTGSYGDFNFEYYDEDGGHYSVSNTELFSLTITKWTGSGGEIHGNFSGKLVSETDHVIIENGEFKGNVR